MKGWLTVITAIVVVALLICGLHAAIWESRVGETEFCTGAFVTALIVAVIRYRLSKGAE